MAAAVEKQTLLIAAAAAAADLSCREWLRLLLVVLLRMQQGATPLPGAV
jgi:hypothetical protein